MKKVILHVNQYGCYRGGVENYIREIASDLTEYDNCLLCYSDADEKYLGVFKEYQCVKTEADIGFFIDKVRPSHVVIYNIFDKSMNAFFDLREKYGFKIIKSFHDYYMFYVGTGYNRLTLQRTKDPIGLTSLLSCLSRDAFTRKFKLSSIRKKIKLLNEVKNVDCIEYHTNDVKKTLERNGIYHSNMLLNPPWAKEIKDEDTTANPKQILFVGNLIRGKGLQLLLKALKNINRDYFLNVAGEGYIREKLEKYASKHDLNVKFLGHIKKEKLSELYKESSFVVMPSVFEPFGFVLLEAMSYKRPSIVFNAGGTSEIISDNVNGFLIKPFKIKSLQKKIQYFLDNPETAKKMGIEGYNIFKSRFTYQHHLDKLRSKLHELENESTMCANQ